MAGQWYMAIGGHQVGPVSAGRDPDQPRQRHDRRATRCVFTAGMANWTPLKDVPQFAADLTPARPRGAAPPPPCAGRRAHDIDFKIIGNEMQFVEVELDPGESAVAEAGSMMYMTPGIQMETVFGDGSQQRERRRHGRAARRRQAPADRREPVHDRVHQLRRPASSSVAFAAPYPGKILPLDLNAARRPADLPEGLVPLRGARRLDRHRLPAQDRRRPVRRRRLHHAAARGRRPLLRPRRRHAPRARARAGRDAARRHGLSRRAAADGALRHPVRRQLKTALFGGEGLFFATLTGPGKVWLQSLPFSRMADRIYKAAPQTGRRKEEGSVLDRLGVGDLIDGD